MQKDTHVYCTECKEGDNLISSIEGDKDIPITCKNCFPYNPEDSYKFKERPNFVPR